GMQRSTWLLGQVAIAATFVLLLMPPAQQAAMRPVFEVDLSAAAVHAPVSDVAPEAVAGMLAAAVHQRSPLAWLAWAWVLAYAVGLA
ncbi:hypothetical protein, partial [Acinetobacter baumannii]|uniref:hypothetical protein n=1 Tax=Acinetobacter baumannii TaxID=470 RepID=UPI00289A365C